MALFSFFIMIAWPASDTWLLWVVGAEAQEAEVHSPVGLGPCVHRGSVHAVAALPIVFLQTRVDVFLLPSPDQKAERTGAKLAKLGAAYAATAEEVLQKSGSSPLFPHLLV